MMLKTIKFIHILKIEWKLVVMKTAQASNDSCQDGRLISSDKFNIQTFPNQT